MTHELKCWPEYFKEVVNGNKPFDIRKDDREPRFEKRDFLHLSEWEPFDLDGNGHFTGCGTLLKVTYVLRDYVGIKEGYVVMGLKQAP